MTAKRFTFHHDVDGIDYIEDESNGICLICDELMCKVLNRLHEENEQLKSDMRDNYKKHKELLDENEQLKQQLQSEHQMLENAILLERTRMGKNCLKQYKEAIQ